jgi:DNA-directed RNA polymerase subunit RPC12/RpoP
MEYTCLRCHGPLIDGGERYLVDEARFSFMRQWLHVRVLECPSCGHVELIKGRLPEEDVETYSGESEQTDALRSIGAIPGGANLPPEDPMN